MQEVNAEDVVVLKHEIHKAGAAETVVLRNGNPFGGLDE